MIVTPNCTFLQRFFCHAYEMHILQDVSTSHNLLTQEVQEVHECEKKVRPGDVIN